MATATALFGIPCTILEGAGIEPWDVPMDTPGEEVEAPALHQYDSDGHDEETVNPLADDGEATGETQDEAAAEAPETTSLTDFQGLSVKQLRELAKVMGVSASGNKAALVERVTTAVLPLGMTDLPLPFTHLSPWFSQ